MKLFFLEILTTNKSWNLIGREGHQATPNQKG